VTSIHPSIYEVTLNFTSVASTLNNTTLHGA